MNVSFFSVYDKKAQSFAAPFPAVTPGAAERMLSQSIKDPNSTIAQYPDDFALYSVFVWDDASGIILERFEPPRLVCEASGLVA